jgi:polysaccharide export outer membrane protein
MSTTLLLLYLVAADPLADQQKLDPPKEASVTAPRPKKDTAASTNTSGDSWAYRIGPEDIVQISVWNNDALSRAVPVRPDGMISLPLLNDVQAAGLTPTELRSYLMKRLAEYLPSPEVSVIVTDVRSLKVSVVGAVTKPGRYDLKSWATVLDAIAMAGGFTDFASKSNIMVLRSDGKRSVRLPFNYDKVASDGTDQSNFYLRPGDIVLVK